MGSLYRKKPSRPFTNPDIHCNTVYVAWGFTKSFASMSFAAVKPFVIFYQYVGLQTSIYVSVIMVLCPTFPFYSASSARETIYNSNTSLTAGDRHPFRLERTLDQVLPAQTRAESIVRQCTLVAIHVHFALYNSRLSHSFFSICIFDLTSSTCHATLGLPHHPQCRSCNTAYKM